MANEFVTRTGLIVSGSTFLPAATSASKGYILSFDASTKEVYYMSTSSVTVTVPGSDTQVIYNNGGAFGASSNFVFSGSNVGIGTTSPSYKLHVVGEIYASSNLFGSVVYSNTYRDQAGGTITLQDDGGSVAINKGSANATLDVSGSVLISGSLTVSGSSTFTNIGPAVFTGSITQNASTASFGGLVGIGTTTPSTTLDVAGTISNNSSQNIIYSSYDNVAALFQRVGTYGGVVRLGRSGVSNSTTIDYPADGTFAVSTDGSERLRITSAGNVGIGTTSPSRKLIVYDTDANVPTIGLRTDGSGLLTTNGFDLQFASSNTFLFNRENGYTAFGTNNTERVRIAATGDTHIGTTAYTGVGGSGYLMVKNVIGIVPDNTGSANNRNWAIQANGQFSGSLDFVSSAASASFPNDAYRVSFTRTGGVVASSFTGSFSGSVSAPGSTTQIVYNSGGALAADSGLVYSGSRVGIGTTTPANNLHIYGTGDQIIKIENSGTYLMYAGLVSNEGYIGSTNATPLGFYTNNTNRMYINTSGNIGIGTTSPSTKLQVDGTLTVTNGGINIPADTPIRKAGDNSIILYSTTLPGISIGSGTVTDMVVFNAGGTERVRINTSGSMGIGTSSPSYTLDVAGDINTSTGVYRIGGSTILAGTTNVVVGSSGATGTVSLNTTSGAGLVLNGANVGIGTASPTGRLTIAPYATSNSSSIEFTGTDNAVISSYYSQVIAVDNTNTQSGRQIVFAKGGKGYGTQTKTMMVIDADSGNVGMGVLNPTYNLEVSGSGYISGSLTVAGTITAQKLNVQQITSSVIYSSGSNIFGNSVANTQTFTGSLQVTGSSHYLLGNVGIGTTSPSTKLDVWNGNLRVSGSTNEQLILDFAASVGNYTYQSFNLNGINKYRYIGYVSGDFGLYSDVASSYPLYISASGNVGIGTTSPTRPLTVKSSNIGIRMDNSSNSNAGLEYYVSTGTFYNWLLGAQYNVANTFEITPSTTIGGTTYSTPAFVVNANGNVGIGTTSPSNTLQVVGGVTATSFTGSFSGSITAPGSTTQVAFNSGGTLSADSGFVYSGSNVGIGTTNPATRLQVSDSTATTQLSLSNSGGGGGATLGTDTSGNLFVGAPSNIYFKTFGGTNSTIIGTSGQIILNSSANTTFTGTGNVGIGTTSPSAKLQVKGDGGATGITFQTTDSSNNQNLYVLDGGRAGTQYYPFMIAHSSSFTPTGQAYLQVATSALYVSQSGAVGIGTTSPARKLDVNGTSVFRDFTSVFAGSGNIVSNITWLSTDSGLLNVYSGGSPTVQLNSNGVSYFNGGNVGIGTTTPSTKLFVSGSHVSGQGMSTFKGSDYSIINLVAPAAGDGSNGYWGFRAQDPSFNDLMWFGHVTSSTQSGFVVAPNFDTANSASLYVARSNGNVGIGTSSPGAKLQITGGTLDGASLTDLGISSGLTTGRLGTFDASSLASISTRGDASSVELAAGSSATYYTGISATANNATSFTGTLRFFTSGSEKVRITPSGNVGIGTTDPTSQMSGTFGIGIYNALYPAVGFKNSTTAWLWYGQDSTFRMWNVTAGDILTANTSGNIGIGTTSPDSKLTVSGSNVDLATFYNNNTKNLTITSAGNLSFNTGTSLGLLWSPASLKFEGQTQGITARPYAANYVTFTVAGASSQTANLQEWQSSGGSVYSVVNSTGNFGIGTTTPTQRLQVSGAIAIENQGTTTIETTTFSGSLTTNTNIASVPTASFKAAFFDYYVASGSVNMRAGTVMAVHNNSTSRYTDTSTGDIGTTAAVDFSTSIVAGSLVLTANISSGTWEVKTAYKAL